MPMLPILFFIAAMQGSTPPFALVLGVAITLRGLWDFRPLPADTGSGTATAPSTSDMTAATDPASTPQADIAPGADGAPGAATAYQVRDLREPLIMTIAGVLICLFTILGIAALVNSA